MKIYFIILLSVFLIACNEYTITNNTDSNVQLAKSGGDTLVVPAQSCVKLMELLIGMGGDFPFSFKNCSSCKKEYTSGHYEIKRSVSPANEEQKSDEALITVTASNENTDCDGTDDEESEEEQEQEQEESDKDAETKTKPTCKNEGFELACQNEQGQTISNQVQCKSDANNSITIICVIGDKGFPVAGLKPFCIKEGEKKQDPICQVESTDGT